MIADEVLTSIPAYTTTATTLVASADLSPTITLDYSTYNYYILERCLTIPTYSISTKAKGRVEYHAVSKAYEVTEVPADNFITLIDSNVKLTSRSVTLTDAGVFHRLYYWSNGTTTVAYSSSSYGTYQAVVAPTISSGILTLKTPTFGIRGHTTYFTSTFFNAVTELRYQYVIEVYRAPKANLNLDGWGLTTQLMKVIDCVNNNNCTLT